MTDAKLKVAYLCDQSPMENWTYSGGNARLLRLVEKHIGPTTILSQKWHNVEFVRQALMRMPEAVMMRAQWRSHVFLSRLIAREIENELARDRYDVLFCPYSFHSLLNIRPPYPIVTVHSSDATPTAYKNSPVGAHFGSFFAPSRWLDPLVLKAEKKVFRSTDLLLWPSEWLKTEADALYGLSDEQSHWIPWGANAEPQQREHLNFDLTIEKATVQLLLVGRDWIAKGGPLTVAVLDELTNRGFKAHLSVVGCEPPEEDRRSNMTVVGYLDRNKQSDKAQFEQLMLSSHFLLMPSYESYGFAFAEASAYAMPSLVLRVGGVPIVDGINGHALPENATAAEFADRIQSYISGQADYQQLRRTSRQYFEERLNWDAWGRAASALIADKVEKNRTANSAAA